MKDQQEANPFDKLGQPAQRALANAGIQTVEQLAQWSEKELMKLHGMGKASLLKLIEALSAKGLSFRK